MFTFFLAIIYLKYYILKIIDNELSIIVMTPIPHVFLILREKMFKRRKIYFTDVRY